MPYNKGDFTQQGINGDVSALVRLNEKRIVKVVLSSDDESDNCDISGKVYDLLNGTSYDIGSGGGVGGLPTMELTIINDTGEELAANYESGISYEISNSYGIDALNYVLDIDETYEANVLYNYVPGLFGDPDEFNVHFAYVYGDFVVTNPSATNLDNCTFSTGGGAVKLTITDPSQPSSATVTLTKVA